MKKTLLGLFLIVTVTIGLTACGTENFSELKDDQARANYLGRFLDETENAKDEETMSSRIFNFSSFNEFEKTVFKDFKSQSETTKKMEAAGIKISRRYGNLKKYDDTTYAISSWTDISYKGESVQGKAVFADLRRPVCLLYIRRKNHEKNHILYCRYPSSCILQ